MGCKKCAEGICGCSTMNGEQADEWWPSLVISIDTSGSTMEGNVNFKYKKIAMHTINNLKPPNVIIFDHNGNVQKVFEGSAEDAMNFLRDSTNLRPRNGTARMKDVMDAVMGINGHKLILTDGMESRTKNAEESAVQEPDWIPDGDGRAIGQQNFGINLSPLHAEDEDYNAEQSESVLKKLRQTYDMYESTNQHTSNYLLLATFFGTDAEKEKVKKLIAKKNRKGGLTQADNQWLYKNINPYYDNLRNVKNAESFNAEESWGFVVVDGKGLRTDAFRTKEQARFYAQKSRDEAGRKGVRVVKAKKSDDRMNKAQMDIIFGKGWDAETTGSPSPTFNEDITGQDGPSDSPTNSNFSAETRPYKFRSHANTYHLLTDDGKATRCGMSGMSIRFMQDYGGVGDRTLCGACNPESKSAETQTFEAMRTLAPSTRDVDNARRQLKNSGYGEVIYDRYIVNQQGSSNKFYYTAITEKDGKYYPMGAYGRIGYLGTLFNVAGKKENPYSHFGSMELAYRQIRGKEVSKINARKPEKRYVDYTLTRGAESLSEIEGPTAEATTGGLHSPSSFAMTWEDGTGQSSASIPPNEIAWAETSGIPLWIKVGAGIALVLAGKKLVSSRSSAQKAENNLKSSVKARKGCCGSSKTVRKDSEFSVGQINPVEVTGESDVYGAEELHSPQTSAKVSQPNWGPQTTYLQNQRSTQKMW